MHTFTGVFGLEALDEYRMRKGSSLIAGKISSAKTFAHERSNAFCSREVRPPKLSVSDNC